jgi:hypothetical protein
MNKKMNIQNNPFNPAAETGERRPAGVFLRSQPAGGDYSSVPGAGRV